LRRLAEGANKSPAHALGVAETGTSRHKLDRFGATLDPFARGFEAQALDRLGRRHPGFGGKGAGEMTWAHRRAIGQSLDRKPFVEPLARPGEQR
jgi:hypothetical protein